MEHEKELYQVRECCDGPGGAKPYHHQVSMPINGKVRGIDWCIHRIVATLNAGGIKTTSSCCSHKTMLGRIDLADGRMLVITEDPDNIVWRKDQDV